MFEWEENGGALQRAIEFVEVASRERILARVPLCGSNEPGSVHNALSQKSAFLMRAGIVGVACS